MRYYRVFWNDSAGIEHISDPLPTLTSAHAYAEIVGGTIYQY